MAIARHSCTFSIDLCLLYHRQRNDKHALLESPRALSTVESRVGFVYHKRKLCWPTKRRHSQPLRSCLQFTIRWVYSSFSGTLLALTHDQLATSCHTFSYIHSFILVISCYSPHMLLHANLIPGWTVE